MQRALKFFSDTDALVQKAVDTASHAVMRRCGIEKPSIRYAIFGFCGAVQLAKCAVNLAFGRADFLISFLLLMFAGGWAVGHYRRDALADREEFILSPFDAERAETVHRWKLFLLAVIALNALVVIIGPSKEVVEAAPRLAKVNPCLSIVMFAALFVEAYLVKTPKRPPSARKKAEERPPLAVAAPSVS
jgi:hypothetical protein